MAAWGLFAFLTAHAWDERGPDAARTGRVVVVGERFSSANAAWPGHLVHTSPLDLALVAAATADVLRAQRDAGQPLATAGLFGELGVSFDDVLDTLDLVVRIAHEDRGEPHQRLQDPAWLSEHFVVYRWAPDRTAAARRGIRLDATRIRLTKYVVYRVEGSDVRTDRFHTALYATPDDAGVRARLTRMDVYGGALDAGGEAAGQANPLVWLTRDGVNQALMQGTIEVELPGDRTRLFNVHENNGRPWDPSVKDPNLQARYWYFRGVDGILGVEGIPLRPGAAVAGDVHNLGLGKLVALEWETPEGPELRLVVLADTGGAFEPNLFQLDLMAGTFDSVAAYQAWAQSAPTRVPAAILVRR